MELRSPLNWLVTLGWLGWPIGVFAFGGSDDDTGVIFIGVGSLLILGSMAIELLLRKRDKPTNPPFGMAALLLPLALDGPAYSDDICVTTVTRCAGDRRLVSECT